MRGHRWSDLPQSRSSRRGPYGLAADEYPYRKIADSVRWQGTIRDGIPVDYALRMLNYDANIARIGGIVSVTLPKP